VARTRLSRLDYSYPADLSADGKQFYLTGRRGGEAGMADARLTYAVYIRNTDGLPRCGG